MTLLSDLGPVGLSRETFFSRNSSFKLGVSKSCPNLPNLATYGETGEIPLSLKAFRLLINFWHRISNQTDDSLAKKALLENIDMRTIWIKTVEKFLGP